MRMLDIFKQSKDQESIELPFRRPSESYDCSKLASLMTGHRVKKYFVCTSDRFQMLRKAKDGNGSYLVQPSLDLDTFFLMGYEVIIDDEADGLYVVLETPSGLVDFKKFEE